MGAYYYQSQYGPTDMAFYQQGYSFWQYSWSNKPGNGNYIYDGIYSDAGCTTLVTDLDLDVSYKDYDAITSYYGLNNRPAGSGTTVPANTATIESNAANGKSYTTTELFRSGADYNYDASAGINYPDTNDSELTDGIVPTDNEYSNDGWIGLHYNTPKATQHGYVYVNLDLEELYDVTKISVYMPDDDFDKDAGVVGPDPALVSFYADGELIEAETTVTAYNDNISIYSIEAAEAVKAQNIEIRIVHGGWVFISEVAVEGAVSTEEPTPDPEPDPVAKGLRGDVNMSGAIDARDYVILKRAYFGTTVLDEIPALLADVNNSGGLDARDYVTLKRAYFGTYEIPEDIKYVY